MQNLKDKLFGNWQALTGILAGEAISHEIVSATKLTISQSQYVVDLAGVIDSGACELGVDVDPIRMKIHGNEGPNAGRTFLAILKFTSDDEIRVAYDLSGTEYPQSFNSTSAESNYVATFKKC